MVVRVNLGRRRGRRRGQPSERKWLASGIGKSRTSKKTRGKESEKSCKKRFERK